MLGSYTRFVAGSAPGTFMFETMFFLMFFLWRCGGMMLLGMSLYKSGFLDGRLSSSTYARVALIATPVGLALAFIGALELERVAYAMPIRAAVDLWNYGGAVFASIGYAAALIWIVKHGRMAGARRRLAAVGQMAFSNYLFHSRRHQRSHRSRPERPRENAVIALISPRIESVAVENNISAR
jgi:uncharacterized membrane protein YeiB